ncbi:MAG: tol-pal system protein YbgF [Deferrisomatales bacterium]|nr:tol-pal system protein YbgF [Deferrisomatales bacterium]
MAHRLAIRCSLLGVLSLVLGCAAPGSQTQVPEWQAPLADQAQAQNRMELRMEEMTRNLLVLRERVDSLETALNARDRVREQIEPPPLTVVRLQPPAQASPTAPAASTPADSAAADLYRKAFNAYREGRFGEAILDFEEFLRGHPDHEYADNAQYWIGESYYSQGEYEQAVVEFNRVLDRYPHEAKAPDALLKIGLAYEQLGQPDRARVFWTRLTTQHPHSEASREAQRRLNGAQ